MHFKSVGPWQNFLMCYHDKMSIVLPVIVSIVPKCTIDKPHVSVYSFSLSLDMCMPGFEFQPGHVLKCLR